MKAKYVVKPIDEKTFVIVQYLATSDAICYLLIGEEKALLIDTGLHLGGLLETVRTLTDKPVIVVNTHAHLDHIGENAAFGSVLYCPKDAAVLKLHTDPDYLNTLVKQTFPGIVRLLLRKTLARITHIPLAAETGDIFEGDTIDLGGRVLEVIETPGHTAGSICLLERGTGRLYSGDTVCDWGILLILEGHCEADVFLDSIQKLKKRAGEIETIWPGHHRFPIEPDYLDEYERCAEGILDKSLPVITEKDGRHFVVYKRVRIAIDV